MHRRLKVHGDGEEHINWNRILARSSARDGSDRSMAVSILIDIFEVYILYSQRW